MFFKAHDLIMYSCVRVLVQSKRVDRLRTLKKRTCIWNTFLPLQFKTFALH